MFSNDYLLALLVLELIDEGRKSLGSISFLSSEPFLFFEENGVSLFHDLASVDLGFTRAESLESFHAE